MILGQVASSERLFGDVLPWLGGIVLLILIGGAIAIWVRRRMFAGDSSSEVGFTLSDLREMRARGEISEEEYQRAHQRMVEGVRRSADPTADADSVAGIPSRGTSTPGIRRPPVRDAGDDGSQGD